MLVVSIIASDYIVFESRRAPEDPPGRREGLVARGPVLLDRLLGASVGDLLTADTGPVVYESDICGVVGDDVDSMMIECDEVTRRGCTTT